MTARTPTLLWTLGLGALLFAGLTIWLFSMHHAGTHSFNLDLGISVCLLLALALGLVWTLIVLLFNEPR